LHFSDNLLPPPPPGLAGVKHLMASLWTAFPDLKLTISAESGQGRTRVYTWVAHGTHKGPLMQVRATGKRVRFPGRFMMRHEDERIAELWTRTSLLSLISQLGMAPQVVR
jgi:predicted ester cyclase